LDASQRRQQQFPIMKIDHSPIATHSAVVGNGARNAVCLCTDRNMLIPALFVAHSVRTMSAPSGTPFEVVIVAEAKEVTDVHRVWMAEHGILLHEIDLSGLHGLAKIQQRLSVATLTKLLLAKIFAGRYDRILYLDADLTIHDDASAIFALDTGEFPLAACSSGLPWAFHNQVDGTQAQAHFAALGMTPPYRFFNSGVLYINVARWNRGDLSDRTLSFIARNADICFLPDEHGLNGVLDGAFAPVSPIWNMRPHKNMRSVAHDVARPVIVHHAGEDKPWRRFGYRKRLFPDRTAYRMYEAFLRDTPWPRWLDEQWSARDLRANITWEVRRITRALRGRSSAEPSRGEHEEYLTALRRYCAEERFADVEQGIVIRDGGPLRLRHSVAVAA
jgi:lipopolysaccharide biosynthesis glycosyltransferase